MVKTQKDRLFTVINYQATGAGTSFFYSVGVGDSATQFDISILFWLPKFY